MNILEQMALTMRILLNAYEPTKREDLELKMIKYIRELQQNIIEIDCPNCKGIMHMDVIEKTGVIDPVGNIEEIINYSEPCEACKDGRVKAIIIKE